MTRVKAIPSDGHLVAIAFETHLQASDEMPVRRDRRSSVRTRLALPMQVRQEGLPWAEETMTIDLSEDGALFGASRVYRVGNDVRARLENVPWPGRNSQEEISARVVRVTLLQETSEQLVAFCLKPEVGPFR